MKSLCVIYFGAGWRATQKAKRVKESKKKLPTTNHIEIFVSYSKISKSRIFCSGSPKKMIGGKHAKAREESKGRTLPVSTGGTGGGTRLQTKPDWITLNKPPSCDLFFFKIPWL